MERVQIFSLQLCLRTRGELMLKLIFLLFLKIKGFLGEKFTSDYLSTYLWTKKNERNRFFNSCHSMLSWPSLLTAISNTRSSVTLQHREVSWEKFMSSSHRVFATPLSCPLSYETLKAHSLFDKSYLSCRVSIFHHCWQRPIITIEQ